MNSDKNKEIREDRFTWKEGDFKFLTPEENKKRLEEKKAIEQQDKNK
jgi:hypothetical protein